MSSQDHEQEASPIALGMRDMLSSYPKNFRYGKRVYLDVIRPADYELIAESEQAPPSDVLYRNQAQTPSPQVFVESLWSGVLVQFMAREVGTDAAIGTVTCYNADFRNAHAYIAIHIFPELRLRGWPLEGLVLLVNYLFFAFPFIKLYAEVVEPNLESLRGELLRSVVHREARLRRHSFVAGEYRDRVTLAVYREEWNEKFGDGMPQSGLTGRVRVAESEAGSTP